MRHTRTNLLALACLAIVALANTPVALGVPLGIANLDVWLDAHDADTLFSDNAGTVAATNLGAVRHWADKSGNNRDAIADVAGSPIRDDAELNGRPSVKFSGAVESLDITGSFTSPYTIFVVDEYNTGSNGRVVNSETTNFLLGKWAGGNRYHIDSVGFIDSNADGFQTATVNVPIITAGMVDTGLNRAFAFRNGANVTAGTPAAGLAPGALEIGPSAGPGGGETSDAAVGEFIAYGRALNVAERIIVNNYLSSKHSIALNTGLGAVDVYDGDAGGIDYDFGVFGIGQDSTGSQVTSTSSDGLTISEANTSLSNNDWLLAGHDGTTNALVAVENGPGERWSRVWHADKTGALDATLAFDFEDADLTAVGGAETVYQLLYSADGDFTDGWTVVDQTGVIASGTVQFTVPNVDLLHGYYTLAFVALPEPSTGLLLGLGSLGLAWSTRRRRRPV